MHGWTRVLSEHVWRVRGHDLRSVHLWRVHLLRAVDLRHHVGMMILAHDVAAHDGWLPMRHAWVMISRGGRRWFIAAPARHTNAPSSVLEVPSAFRTVRFSFFQIDKFAHEVEKINRRTMGGELFVGLFWIVFGRGANLRAEGLDLVDQVLLVL